MTLRTDKNKLTIVCLLHKRRAKTQFDCKEIPTKTLHWIGLELFAMLLLVVPFQLNVRTEYLRLVQATWQCLPLGLLDVTCSGSSTRLPAGKQGNNKGTTMEGWNVQCLGEILLKSVEKCFEIVLQIKLQESLYSFFPNMWFILISKVWQSCIASMRWHHVSRTFTWLVCRLSLPAAQCSRRRIYTKQSTVVYQGKGNALCEHEHNYDKAKVIHTQRM